MVARWICTSFVDPSALQPLLNSRLIALDKNPGVRLIGIGETSRRIISKAILSVLKQDILNTSGCLQLCAGQRGGCEAAVHAMREIFNDSHSKGVLLIDASNAFNSLNCRSALLNMFDLCHPFATVLTNIYRIASNLFIDGTSILSRVGLFPGEGWFVPHCVLTMASVFPTYRLLLYVAPATHQFQEGSIASISTNPVEAYCLSSLVASVGFMAGK